MDINGYYKRVYKEIGDIAIIKQPQTPENAVMNFKKFLQMLLEPKPIKGGNPKPEGLVKPEPPPPPPPKKTTIQMLIEVQKDRGW